MDKRDDLIAKLEELIKLLLKNYTSDHFPMKKTTYIKKVRTLRSEIASLKDEIEKEKTNKSDELKYEFGADNIFNEIDTNL